MQLVEGKLIIENRHERNRFRGPSWMSRWIRFAKKKGKKKKEGSGVEKFHGGGTEETRRVLEDEAIRNFETRCIRSRGGSRVETPTIGIISIG